MSSLPVYVLGSSSPVRLANAADKSTGTRQFPVTEVASDVPTDAETRAVENALVDPRFAKFSTSSWSRVTRYVKFEFKHAIFSDFEIGQFGLVKESNAFSEAKHVGNVNQFALVFEFDMLSQAMTAVKSEPKLDLFGFARFIEIDEYANLLGYVHPSMKSFSKYEGQLLVHITEKTEEQGDHTAACFALLQWMDQVLGSASLYANPLSMGITANDIGRGYSFRIELDSRDQADLLVEQWSKGRKIKRPENEREFYAQLERYVAPKYKPIKAIQGTPTAFQPQPQPQHDSPSPQPRGGLYLRRAGTSEKVLINQLGGVAQLDGAVQLGGAVQPHRERATSGPRRSSFGSGRRDDQNNAIDVERIRRGLDVRTTVMLRNIPNQMTTYDLEALLDSWAHGKFDFLYLRIDFANMCNVGYAFVNFDMPMTIVDVKGKLDAQGWPGHLGSSKRAAMSYATVQGVESLVEKFRNSSVMLEMPKCRPRLFYTFADFNHPSLNLLAGYEKEFPAPNNEAKLARSRQNAETQGLYPAHSRDEYRRDYSRSNFDRGNPNSSYSYSRAYYY